MSATRHSHRLILSYEINLTPPEEDQAVRGSQDSISSRCRRPNGEPQPPSARYSIVRRADLLTWKMCRRRRVSWSRCTSAALEFRRQVLHEAQSQCRWRHRLTQDTTPWSTTAPNATRARINSMASNSSARAGRRSKRRPIDDEASVNIRRAELGLMRVELYAKLVRLQAPAMCGRCHVQGARYACDTGASSRARGRGLAHRALVHRAHAERQSAFPMSGRLPGGLRFPP